MEKVTLHFDMTHLHAERVFTLKAHGKQVRLKRHDHESRRRHADTNAAIALMMAHGHDARLTHYAEDVALPSDAVSFIWTSQDYRRPGGLVDEIATVSQYVPRASVEKAALAMQREGTLTASAGLAHLGVTAVGDHCDPVALHRDVGLLVNHIDTAMVLLMQHPEIGTLEPVTFQRIRTLLRNQSASFNNLVIYLSTHPFTADEPWYENTYVKDFEGNVMEPDDGLTDSEKAVIEWPTVDVEGKPVNAIPQFQLSEGLDDALEPAVKDAVRLLKQQSWLKGRQWNTLQGITGLSRTQVPPTLAESQLSADPEPANARWTMVNKTSMYGLDLDPTSLAFDADAKKITFRVKNWPNRYLSAFVQFLDDSGKTITDPAGGTVQAGVAGKKFLQIVGPGNTFYGAPIWTDSTDIDFEVPATATGATVLFGGLGCGGNFDKEVDQWGTVLTSCISYGIPSVLSVLSVGIQSSKTFQDYMAKPANAELVYTMGVLFLGEAGVVSAQAGKLKPFLIKVGKSVIGFLLSRMLRELALLITGYATAQLLVQNVPFVGWALKLASQALAIAEMAGTTNAVGSSPSTYEIELKRSMTLYVSVSPDPTHQIWPEQADHYQILVKFQGGTTLKKEGRTTRFGSDPIQVCFSTESEDALPSAPGAKFQITAELYTATDSLCGRWASGWIEAVPTEGNSRTEKGAIFEYQAPLLPSTTYTHKAKLRYDGPSHAYLWDADGAPPPGGNALSGSGVKQLVNLTTNNIAAKLGYCYQADSQNLPLDNRPENRSEDMFVFQSISTLDTPGKNMLTPTRGFSVQPYLAFDQFGPAGLFVLDPATDYVSALDEGGPIPELVRNAFSANRFELDDATRLTVVEKDVSWRIGVPGQPPRFDLRRQVDVIKVFTWPEPVFSPNNFYLDTRTYRSGGLSHLRLVDLSSTTATTFDYSTTKSWGAFAMSNLNAIAVHPNGYVIAISYKDSKMAIVKLPEEGVADEDAPQALPLSGLGQREGLMKGPVAMTITADGRILVLEKGNARIQAFDTQSNPVQCFKGDLSFTIPRRFAGDLSAGTASIGLLQELQRNVLVMNRSPRALGDPRNLLTPLFSMDRSFAATLDAGAVGDELRTQFEANALTLAQDATIVGTADGMWLIDNGSAGNRFDVRHNGEGDPGALDVYRCFTPVVMVKSPGREWLVMDKTNGLSFDVTVPEAPDGPLQFRGKTALLALKDPPEAAVTYLDLAVEAKGYIYVLSYVNEGKSASDYRLDIYYPDGTPLTPDPGRHNGHVNAARMVVDPWRTLFTLNYQQMQGPAGRPEPTVSRWIPS